MFDWQRYSQNASAAIARAEKVDFTGQIELRVMYRKGYPRRGYVRRVDCRVLNREPIATAVNHPDHDFDRLRRDLVMEGENADSEISILYSFFAGSVVDIKTEVLNMMS